MLRRRLAKGKEDPARWREKLGLPSLGRPNGRLVWLHAVGLGEVLALRGLISEMSRLAPDLHFLVTSTAKSSAKVMAANLPPRSFHQFLPLDAPVYLERFLDHWRPDLSVWAEQEIWPGAVVALSRRKIPMALVNARITHESYLRRKRAAGLYGDLFRRFSLIAAQEEETASRLTQLGASDVQVAGSLKSAAPPLGVDAAELARLQTILASRKVWVAASTHAADEAEVLRAVPGLGTEFLTIVAPRDIGRSDEIAAALAEGGISFVRRSLGQVPGAQTKVWLADSYGELGIWYRLAKVALVGGAFGEVGGHNPWEPAVLGVPILHGPNTSNFVVDYDLLDSKNASVLVQPGGLATAVLQPGLEAMGERARTMAELAKGKLAPLAEDLVALIARTE
ncbi:3-deoxy-D-manno-octulosonic acid transferase [Thioclava sp. FR2]|uniref:3-deoxy-D-manno-octulosonic acid transferase n=1 Tax=Thioclava sp. FR2 TaxID=3445780 RepID=UPI003EBF476F